MDIGFVGLTQGIAMFVLIIGLLNFAKEAPELFKKLFAKDGIFSGIELNPHGLLGKQMRTAGEVVHSAYSGARSVVTAPYRAARGIYNGVARGARGLAGGIAGMDAGMTAAGGGFFNQLAGASRGFSAGARAGANSSSIANADRAGTYAGGFAGATTEENRTAFSTGRTQMDAVYKAMVGTRQKDIDKREDALKQAKQEYDENINKYRQDNLQAYIQSGRTAAMNNLVAQEMAASGRTENDVRTDTTFMQNAWNQVTADTSIVATASKRVKDEAEAMYKADYEANKRKLESEIANIKGEAMDTSTAQYAIDKLDESMRDWGDKIKTDYANSMNTKMSKIDNKDLQDSINAGLQSALGGTGIYAGAHRNTSIDSNDLRRLISSIDTLEHKTTRTAAEDANLKNQRIALAQVMNTMNGAMNQVNTNLSLAQTTQSTYNPTPSNSGNNGGNSGGGNS